MNTPPLVSILINNYNYGRFLRDAIDSALAQTYPHIEVVVVDDGSTDNSREVIESYGNRIRSVLKENGGQGSAFNAGFAASKGDILCFLDSDDAFYPTKVERIVGEFASDLNVGWVTHALAITDEKRVETGRFHSLGNSFRSDYRGAVRWGRIKISYPPTSGQCFSRKCMSIIAPLPQMGSSRNSVGGF